MRFSDCSSDVCSSDLSSLSLDFTRVQFTPDLMPSDLLGQLVYTSDAAPGGAGSFRFREGPVFPNLLLADAINRTPPKTQAPLPEAMGARQVQVEGHAPALPHPFTVITNTNPQNSSTSGREKGGKKE